MKKSAGATNAKKSQRTDDAAVRLKNVFAAPLTMVADFVAPVIPKSREESDFIRGALGDNFVFDSLEAPELSTLVKAFDKHSVREGDGIADCLPRRRGQMDGGPTHGRSTHHWGG